jgi:uncharacterized protein YeaO (DUF488 family)
MSLRIVQLGSARHPDEGIRFGTVRRPPRGVKKSDYAKENWYDVWLPNLSPSEELLRKKMVVRQAENKSRRVGMKFEAPVELSQERSDEGLVHKDIGWKAFEQRFGAELKQPDRSHLLDALTALSHVTNFSIGCYCSNEKLCHRSILRDELQKRGALIK